MTNLTHLRREAILKPYAYSAFKSQFSDLKSFERFYGSLHHPKAKNDFLRVASSYLFLVKQGDWHIQVEGLNPVIEYYTNSFKLVALFALIESLSEEGHLDFYEWLSKQADDGTFPIGDGAALQALYKEYKKSFGSIRRCISFFDRLPSNRKTALRKALMIDKKPAASIRRVAEFLYNLRSKFVHEGEFVLDIANVSVVSMHKKSVVCAELSMPVLLITFEEGVVAYFSSET